MFKLITLPSSPSKSSQRTLAKALTLGCFLMFLLAALPASAEVLTSTMRTGLYEILPDQLLSLNVADVAVTSEGGTLTLEAYDETGERLEHKQEPLHAGQAVGLQIQGDGYPHDGPTLKVRFVIVLSRKTEAGMIPITTLNQIDLGNLTTEPEFKCTGPAAEEEGPIFNIDCPEVAQSGKVI